MPATLPTPTFLSGDAVPGHLKGVEILSVGMDWPASTGPATFTAEHLADIVRAANEDPHIQVPRVRLGHTSSLNADMPQHDPFAAIGDAEPSFGVLVNLRLENDGAVLVADFDEVPDWLADGAPSLYPSRSAESVWEVEQPQVRHDVQTAGGKRYSAVLTAVALLGAYLPACQDLDDLRRLVAGGPTALSSRPEGTTMSRGAELSVSADEVRQRFNFDWAMDPESVFEDADGHDIDPYWWWCREVRIGPEEVIADDESGHLFRVPFSVTDRDEVLFGDPERVRVQYVSASGAPADGRTDRAVHVEASASVRQKAVSCFARRDQTVAASFTDRPDKPRPPTTASSETEEVTMPETLTPEAFQRLQALPADADQAAIDAALTGTEPTADTPPAADPPASEPTQPAAPQPVAATSRLPDGVTAVDSERLAKLEADAQAGARLARETAERDKHDTIAHALSVGMFPPARREHYERMWDNDPEGTRHLLTASVADGGLAPGTVPTTARSHSNPGTVGGSGGDAYSEVQRRAADLRKSDPSLSAVAAQQAVFRADPALATRYQDERRAA